MFEQKREFLGERMKLNMKKVKKKGQVVKYNETCLEPSFWLSWYDGCEGETIVGLRDRDTCPHDALMCAMQKRVGPHCAAHAAQGILVDGSNGLW
jgi:hypothetical protein